MTSSSRVTFESSDLLHHLTRATPSELDSMTFGVIGFDAEGVVQRYNALESTMAGLSVARVVGQPFFEAIAPCMNNFLVAQRFEDAVASGTALDDTIDYVLTLRMRPTKVKLRLLACSASALRYVLVLRAGLAA